mmetsp:Transcript_36849/g.92599  ORF Transcript_36849/g.92599 Transcript_36849/m.92599 type:complete len:221 (-) Transcript_36849:199-861(-)
MSEVPCEIFPAMSCTRVHMPSSPHIRRAYILPFCRQALLVILTRSRPPGARHKLSAHSQHSRANSFSSTFPNALPSSRLSSFRPTSRHISASSFSTCSSSSLSFSSLALRVSSSSSFSPSLASSLASASFSTILLSRGISPASPMISSNSPPPNKALTMFLMSMFSAASCASRPSLPPSSYAFRFAGFESTSYASLISLKRTSALGSCLFLSGCHLRASL